MILIEVLKKCTGRALPSISVSQSLRPIVLTLLTLGLTACGGGGGGGGEGPGGDGPGGDGPGVNITSTDTGKFTFRVLDSDAQTFSASLANQLSDFMEPAVDSVNTVVDLPGGDVPVTLTGCGVANAFYAPQLSEIFMCFELLNTAFLEYLDFFDDDRDLATEVANSFFTFVTYHEMAHAIDDKLDLPIAGNTESAADSIATVFAVEQGQSPSVLFAAYLFTLSEDGSFADVHPGGADRAGDLICWATGGDPRLAQTESGAQLAQIFIDSGRDCVSEYAAQRGAVETWLPNLDRIGQTQLAARNRQNTETSADVEALESVSEALRLAL